MCPVWGTNEAHFRIRNFPIFALYTFTRSYTRTRDTITTSDCSDTVTSLLCVPIRIKLYPRVSAPVPPRATPIYSQQPQQKERQREKKRYYSYVFPVVIDLLRVENRRDRVLVPGEESFTTDSFDDFK